MRVFSGIQPTGAKHLGNYSGGFRQYAATQNRAHEAGGAAFFCIVDLHSITVAYDPAELRESTLSLAAILFAVRARPGEVGRLRPEPRERARRGGLAAQLRRQHGRAAPDDAVQGQVGAAGVHRGRAVHVPRADGGRHPALPDRCGPGRRGPAPARRARARHRRAVQLALRRDVPRARRDHPRDRWTDHGPAGADEEDVDDGWHRAGDGVRARRAGDDPEEVQDRRHRLRSGGSPRAGQGGNREPDRDPLDRDRQRPRGDRGAVRRSGLRSSSRPTSRRR